MAVKLRMTRMGRRHRPYYRINVIDSRTPRDGRVIEKLGQYDPLEPNKEKQILLNTERAEFWLKQGAIPSDTVSEILLRFGIKHKYAEEKALRTNRARTIARKKGLPYTKVEREAIAAKAAEEAKAAGEKKA
ncbi:MAG: 30S ribosomal protein S16 [Sedimentisphaerales bacterium]|nr:30S ribosomal protein S16 [Sedimentisphaerales bacterium]